MLVLTPTRELAAQVHESFKLYARDLKFVSACIFGGVGMNPQVQAMARGVDVLVACPGRLLDLAGQGSVDLSHVEILVLDEADRMLDDALPICHKRALLAHLITTGAWEQVLVFTRTKHGANRLAEYLDKHGLSAAAIHGNKSQNARTKALADFKAGEIRILVATDIAARGLDIDQLPHVVNFELPNVDEEAISLVAPDEEKLLKSIERMTRQKIADGDLVGFDASAVEAEKPEVRERPEGRNPRNARAPRGESDKGGGSGRKDKGKDKGGKEKEKSASSGRGERPAREQKPRDPQPRQVPRPAPDRDPEEFLDDDVDNFGNRVDYVPPAAPKNQGRGRRPGTAAQSAPRSSAGGAAQGRQNSQRSNNGTGASTGSGAGAGTPKRNGRNGASRDGQPRRDDSRSRRIDPSGTGREKPA